MESSIKTTSYDAFFLKIVAIIGMAMQHTALVLGDVIPVALHFPLQLAGGLTFPIMAYLLVEGYRHTSNVKRYMWRLFIWGLISQVPHTLAFGHIFLMGIPVMNIMFTLFLGLLGLVMYDRIKKRWLFVVLFVLICLVSFIFDWGIIGPVMVFLCYKISSDKMRRIIPPIMAGAYNFIAIGIIGIFVAIIAVVLGNNPVFAEAIADAMYSAGVEDIRLGTLFASLMFPIGSFFVAPLLLRYNGERGRSMKYMFYAFFPFHLLILALIAYVVGIGDLSLFSS